MTAFLPPNLLALFAPRDPITHLPPAAKLGHEKKRLGYGAVAIYLKEFEDSKDTPPPTRVETRDERIERKRREKAEQIAYKLEQDLAMWDPSTGANVSKDAFKTLFVARVNYDTSESKIRREFETYGPIKKIRMVTDEQNGFKPRGYAFIEYERERDMHNAYKNGDGKKIDGRRVLVDVERGRTVKGWRPRRLGGGLGGTRRGGPEENTKYSGRDDNPRRDEEPRRAGEEERPERKRPGRSRSREKERPRRSRSRDRRRRSRDRKDDKEEEEKKRKRSRRSRSNDRPPNDRPSNDRPSNDRPSNDRPPRRSKSRDRRRSRRSRDRGGDKPGPAAAVENPDEPGYNQQSDQAPYAETRDYGHRQERQEAKDEFEEGDNGQQYPGVENGEEQSREGQSGEGYERQYSEY